MACVSGNSFARLAAESAPGTVHTDGGGDEAPGIKNN